MAALPPLRTETHLEIMIHTEADAQTSGAISFGYWMQNAGWDPAYNARVESVADPLKLESIALVRQQTGEDWDRVNLSVSTGTPNRNRSKPNLSPWFLHANHHGSRGAAASTAAAANQMAEDPTLQPRRPPGARPTLRRPRAAAHRRHSQRARRSFRGH